MADPWIRVHALLRQKSVTFRAMEALGVKRPAAIGHLVMFWSAVSQCANNGAVGTCSDAQLEEWGGWEGKRGQFAAFIREHHLTPDGRIREWDEYHGRLEERREKDRARKRGLRADSARNSAGSPQDVQRTSAGIPADVRRTSEHTIRNDTKRDETEDQESIPDGTSDAGNGSDWIAPFLDLWTRRVGIIALKRCAKVIAPVRRQYGPEATLKGLEAYLDEPRNPDKPVKLEYFAQDAARWIKQGETPLVVDGILTARGERVSRSA